MRRSNGQAGDLRRWFQALRPGDLTKNQRFSLASSLLAVLLFAVSLMAPLRPDHYFILALVTLAIVGWGQYTNLRS